MCPWISIGKSIPMRECCIEGDKVFTKPSYMGGELIFQPRQFMQKSLSSMQESQ